MEQEEGFCLPAHPMPYRLAKAHRSIGLSIPFPGVRLPIEPVRSIGTLHRSGSIPLHATSIPFRGKVQLLRMECAGIWSHSPCPNPTSRPFLATRLFGRKTLLSDKRFSVHLLPCHSLFGPPIPNGEQGSLWLADW